MDYVKFKDELKSYIVSKKKLIVCTKCHEIGHRSSSNECIIKLEDKLRKKNKIKKKFLENPIFGDKSKEDLFIELMKELDITENMCKTLYGEIDENEWVDRPIGNINILFDNKKIKCRGCGIDLYNIKNDTLKEWRGDKYCDSCWGKFEYIRDELWLQIGNYRPIQCKICMKVKNSKYERFHYDHLSMFDKTDSICNMVNEGSDIEIIYKEIDKCNIVCVPCHHKITMIEQNLGFSRIKQNLTRKLNNEIISMEEYEKEKEKNNIKYREIMDNIYLLL